MHIDQSRYPFAPNVSADMLFSEVVERGPDERLKLQFEAVSKLDEKEREAGETMIAGVLHMHDVKRRQATVATSVPKPKPKTHARSGAR